MTALPDLLRICEAATSGTWSGKCLLSPMQYPRKEADETYINTFSPTLLRHLLQLIERQQEALKRYGKHTDTCGYAISGNPNDAVVDSGLDCTCGLDAALALPLTPNEC